MENLETKTFDVTYIKKSGEDKTVKLNWFDNDRECSIKTLKEGQLVSLTKNAIDLLGLPDAMGYYIVDILDDELYQIAIRCDELGKDWIEFFSLNEIIINE